MIKYEDIVDYYKINLVYKKICMATKHKKKLVKFELSKFSNFIHIYKLLENKTYKHTKYNIFLIKYPKYRIIMSENLFDKIINHVVSLYLLFPIIEPRLIDMNVATRVGRGLDHGVYLVKNYLQKLQKKTNDIYVLKCDISKYFYNIDHDILLKKLKLIIWDLDIIKIIENIITSTSEDYVNKEIERLVQKEIELIKRSNRNFKDKIELITKLENIPRYKKGKGLPIGNMTSQILAIFYLNSLDHFIKEKLQIKYYVRYMDDFILFHENPNYLKYCLDEIKKELSTLKLTLNKKTEISKVGNGFIFLGYRFLVKNKKVYMLPSKNMKKKIRKHYKKEGNIILERYNGYLKRCKCSQFVYSLKCNKKPKEKNISL